MRRTMAMLTSLTAGVLLLGMGVNSAAAVQPVVQSQVVSADPAGTTPHVLDGQVRAIAEVGDTGIAGGTFTTVRGASTSAKVARQNLVSYNLDTGAIIGTFAPAVNGTVYAVLSSGDGRTAYVAGDFSNVNGTARTSRIIRIDVNTGAIDTTFVSPGFDGIIKDLALSNGQLYVSGTFTTAGPQARTAMASLDPATGAVTSALDLTFAGARNGGSLQVIKFDISADGSKLVVIGNFTSIDGQARDEVAVLSLSSTAATLTSWSTTRYAPQCAKQFDSPMRDVSIDSTGTYFVVVTTGGYAGGAKAGVLCDTATRWELNATAAGQQPTWTDYTGGDTFTSVAVAGAAIYVGGHFRWLNNPYGNGVASTGAVARAGIAALNPLNGLPLAWNPGRTRGEGVFALVATSRGLWVGSDTDSLGGEYHARIGLFPLTGGTTPVPVTVGTLPGNVYSLGAGMTDVVGGRAFTGSATTRAWKVSSTLAWHSVRGAFAVNGTVYYGTTNGHLAARTFTGTTFGGAQTIDLLGNTSFAAELKKLSGAFYDPATGRLYYTVSGSARLYYRYFDPATRIVGAIRYDGPANLTGLDWSRTASMFLASGNLYVASADGTLRSFTWNSAAGSPVSGTAKLVGGPKVDKRTWAARGAVVL